MINWLAWGDDPPAVLRLDDLAHEVGVNAQQLRSYLDHLEGEPGRLQGLPIRPATAAEAAAAVAAAKPHRGWRWVRISPGPGGGEPLLLPLAKAAAMVHRGDAPLAPQELRELLTSRGQLIVGDYRLELCARKTTEENGMEQQQPQEQQQEQAQQKEHEHRRRRSVWVGDLECGSLKEAAELLGVAASSLCARLRRDPNGTVISGYLVRRDDDNGDPAATPDDATESSEPEPMAEDEPQAQHHQQQEPEQPRRRGGRRTTDTATKVRQHLILSPETLERVQQVAEAHGVDADDLVIAALPPSEQVSAVLELVDARQLADLDDNDWQQLRAIARLAKATISPNSLPS